MAARIGLRCGGVSKGAGLDFGNGRYRVWAWSKNVTDEYYWTNVFANGNAIARFVGQPATYGVSFLARF